MTEDLENIDWLCNTSNMKQVIHIYCIRTYAVVAHLKVKLLLCQASLGGVVLSDISRARVSGHATEVVADVKPH